MSETVVLKVAMSCQGCVGAVHRVLTKMEGVDSFDINKEEQKVTVIGNVKPEDVFQTVSKTGKKTSFWEPEPASEIPKTEPESTTPIAETPKTEPEVTTTVTTDTSTPPPQTTA